MQTLVRLRQFPRSCADIAGAILGLFLRWIVCMEDAQDVKDSATQLILDRAVGQASDQDAEMYKFFNTNNLWVDLRALKNLYRKYDGALPLPVMKNSKTVDPRDKASTKVLQLETAMGAAIQCFPGASALVIPRTRFAPVKTTNDLLALRSDAYMLTEDFRIVLKEERQGVPPDVKLDGMYKFFDAMEKMIPNGAPSLVGCKKLVVEGEITFAKDVVIKGTVTIKNSSGSCKEVLKPSVPAGTYEDCTKAGWFSMVFPLRRRPGTMLRSTERSSTGFAMEIFLVSPPLAKLLGSYLPPLAQQCIALLAPGWHKLEMRDEPKFWVLGGTGPPSLESVDGFDIAKRRWEFQPPLPGRRCGHCANIMGKHLYILGGIGAPRGASRWSAEDHSWTELPMMPVPRIDSAAAVLDSGLYVLGGAGNANASNKPLALCTRWLEAPAGPSLGSWESVPSMSSGRCALAAVVLGAGLVATGGVGPQPDGCERFDAARRRWTPGPRMALGRCSHAAVACGGHVLVMGGLCHGRPSSSVECWSVGSKRWTTLPSMQMRRFAPCAAVLTAGKVYVCGGSDGAQSLSTVESYDFDAQKPSRWCTVSSLRVARHRACAVATSSGEGSVDGEIPEGKWRF
ncbi:unnamed protein product [Cladocopium goreaui]|uniref:UTP--glucose-1-phosphate uridylyltransferase n=1 Tax=Cladocopium goreaui TaxID=2562237 RepID=A0A9P1D5G7_9DINO|nr:unnamed protein product [Cladocopium goreaui]